MESSQVRLNRLVRKRVLVHDGLVDADLRDEIWRWIESPQCAWSFSNRGDANDPITSWVADLGGFDGDDMSAEEFRACLDAYPFVAEIWGRVAELLPAGARPRRAFLNGHTFGLGDAIHQDGSSTSSTALIHLCRTWPPQWGGETQFFSLDRSEIIKAVLPRPGRVVIFPGHIPHRGSAPGRLCTELRVTMALQCKID